MGAGLLTGMRGEGPSLTSGGFLSLLVVMMLHFPGRHEEPGDALYNFHNRRGAFMHALLG